MTGVPDNVIIPTIAMDFDSSRANAGSSKMPIRVLVLGQRVAAGTVAALEKYRANSAAEVALKSGNGSMLANTARTYFRNARNVDTTFIGIADEQGATKSTHSITIAGTATEDGELPIYCDGIRVAVPVSVGDTGGDIVSAAVDLANEKSDLIPGVASVVTTTTFRETSNNAGVAAGDMDLRVCANEGEQVPAGIMVSAETSVAGTVDPDVQDVIDVIGDDWYNVIINPYSDATNTAAWESFMRSYIAIDAQKGGIVYQFKRDTHANMISFGVNSSRNCPYVATYPAYKRLQSIYRLAAAVGGAAAVSLQDDVAVPLHRINLEDVTVLNSADRWTPTERNQLAMSGIATLSDYNSVQTEATVTMYLRNSAGAQDTAYQQQNTVYQLLYARYAFVNGLLSKYPRAKLCRNDENVEAGQQIMTIDIATSEAVLWFKLMQKEGVFEGGQEVLDQFIADLVVRRVGANRIEWIVSPDLMNQFIVGSATLAFVL
jgi:phage tail sheath gpL-like